MASAQPSKEGPTSASKKKRRQRLACKGSFKQKKIDKEGGQPMPGVLDFPSKVPLSTSSLMHGILNQGSQLVQIKTHAGKVASHMGFVQPGSKGAHFLHPEESVFLVECGRLLVHRQGSSEASAESVSETNITSIQEAYCRLLTPSVPLQYYLVYAHLARMGYKVIIKSQSSDNSDPSRQRVYDVHTPKSQFCKTNPFPPEFRIVAVYRWDQPFPTVHQMIGLRNNDKDNTTSSVPVKVATVTPDGDVNFYSI